jgi:GYF domain 2
MSDAWYVLSEEQQLGPYTGEQLVEFAQEGRIVAETMVWADGMAEWVTAAQIEGLIAQPVAVAAKPVLATSNWAPPGARAANPGARVATSTSPYQAPVSGYAPMQAIAAGGDYPVFPIKPASFGLWLSSVLGAFGCVIIMGLIANMSSSSGSEGQMSDSSIAAAGISVLIFLGIAVLLFIFSWIYFYVILYRAWNCLRYGRPRTTPGKAIGMLFIPIYQIYWIFVAISGLPQDWNRVMGSHENLKMSPRMSEGLFLTFCICTLVILGFIITPFLLFPMVSQMCKGINFFAYRRNQTASANTGVSPSSLGGLKFK